MHHKHIHLNYTGPQRNNLLQIKLYVQAVFFIYEIKKWKEKRKKKSAQGEAEDQLTSWISSRETRLTGPLDMAEVPKCIGHNKHI
jgi:hypothetical protein